MRISVDDVSLELQGLRGPKMVQTFRNYPKLYGCEMSRNLAWVCWSHVSAASCRMDLKQMHANATDCYSALETCLMLFRGIHSRPERWHKKSNPLSQDISAGLRGLRPMMAHLSPQEIIWNYRTSIALRFIDSKIYRNSSCQDCRGAVDGCAAADEIKLQFSLRSWPLCQACLQLPRQNLELESILNL